MKSLISIAEICPLGYYSIDQNLSGLGWELAQPYTDPSRSLQDCADICNHRSGCTSFKYHPRWTICNTYTGGDSNIMNRSQSGSNWFSCVRKGQGLYLWYLLIEIFFEWELFHHLLKAELLNLLFSALLSPCLVIPHYNFRSLPPRIHTQAWWYSLWGDNIRKAQNGNYKWLFCPLWPGCKLPLFRVFWH